MAVREYGQRSIRWRLGGAQWGPFDGGLNLRDQYLDVASNELISGTNLTLDERGECYKRNNCPASASFPAPPAGTVLSSFYSVALGLGIIQVGTTVYKCALGGGSWTSFRVNSSSAICQFCDFAGKLVYLHPVDGVFTYDGTTNTSVYAPGGFAAEAIATWQNKVWISGGTLPRVVWCAAGDPTTWNAADFVDIRDKDNKPGKALWPSSGLLVFKEDSFYRINDSTTGAYQTIDWHAGCVGPRAVTSSDGQVIFWGLDGLYATNGISPAVNVGDKVRPIYSNFVNATTKSKISAEWLNNRVYFTFPSASSTIADSILEYNPRVGWIMEHDLGGSAVGPLFGYLDANGVRQVSFALGSAAIKDAYTSTALTGFAFDLQTSWIEPFGSGALGRLERLSIVGLFAAVTFPIRINYMTELGTTGIGTPNWISSFTPATGFQPASLRPLLRGRAFQLQISDSTPTPSGNFRVFNVQMSNLLTAIR